MRILYIFPHPDDESFGPASAIDAQVKAGHEVYLLTLTRGGATKQRFKLGLSVEQMGQVRIKEMDAVKDRLGLAGLTILDLPDNGLAEMDPHIIEGVVITHLRNLRPHVVVTYPVHGISGFEDHLVTHAVVKHAFTGLRALGDTFVRRLAFFTLPETIQIGEGTAFKLSTSPMHRIDCIVPVTEENAAAMEAALDCYTTYQETIAQSGVRAFTHAPACFEFYMEKFDPPLSDICAELP